MDVYPGTQAVYPETQTVYPGTQAPPVQHVQPVQPVPGNTVVIVNQPKVEYDMDFYVKHGNIPGGIMIFIGIVNLIMFIVGIVVIKTVEAEYIAALILYGIVGSLACASCSKSAKKGIAVATIVFAVISLVMAFAQIITRGLGIGVGAILRLGINKEIGNAVTYISVVLLILALLAFACSIALIVLPSKVVCGCCAPRRTETIVIQNTQQTHTTVSEVRY